MPTLFTAHGSPMNALGGTPFSTFLNEWAETIPKPRAVLCISAHWERHTLAVTTSALPETIHDFYGFPEALYKITYPAPGSPEIAEEVITQLESAGYVVDQDHHRGLDHGTWSPLRFFYPHADIPILQLSLPARVPLSDLFLIGKALIPIRESGILILGSGNLVHNLSTVNFELREAPVPGWAQDFDEEVKRWILTDKKNSLGNPWNSSPQGRISHPTLEHYAPLLIIYGAGGTSDISFPFEGFEHGTISMRCVQFG
jgi:4,5-DOPA dioxygenase extradiol